MACIGTLSWVIVFRVSRMLYPLKRPLWYGQTVSNLGLSEGGVMYFQLIPELTDIQ